MIAARNRALLGWYRVHGRSLPWRGSRDPWEILVSEIMSQQTQVARVVPQYATFMERYPTPGAFAVATDREALEVWSGLGYNSRGLRLRDAARKIAGEGFPTTVEGLMELPGVGPYTAAALACFAFGEPVAAVDTNLRRVLSRWVGIPLRGRLLSQTANELVAVSDPAAWNQAVMDLGSTHCRPQHPQCDSCPVARWCADPGIYEPPPSQGPWQGSNRRARGRIVKTLLAGPRSSEDLVRATGLTEEECGRAVQSLLAEGVVSYHWAGYGIADRASRR